MRWYSRRPPVPPSNAGVENTALMTQTFAGVVRAESHTQIGLLIESSATVILDQWCARAIDEEPAARRVDATVLRDHLAKLLRTIGRALCEPSDTKDHRLPALQHGEQRWESGWSLTELVRDYRLLRLVVVEFLENTLARSVSTREIMAIGVFIDDAIDASIAAYTKYKEEEVVQERTRALKLANQRKDEFLAVLGHELRNPLAPIATSVRVIRTTLGSTEGVAKQSLDVIERQTVQLSRLVDDMLDLARIGQGRFELRKSRLALARIIEQAAVAVAPIMKAHGHRFEVRAAESDLELDADPDRLLQVIVNLLNNAAKYTTTGGEISLMAERSNGDAVIRVRDSGIGIPPDMLSRVFDLFTQVEGATRYAEGGLGIGLTLVHRLVEQHGGTVSCHSEGKGKGSEFVVRLPLAYSGAARALADTVDAGGFRIVRHPSDSDGR